MNQGIRSRFKPSKEPHVALELRVGHTNVILRKARFLKLQFFQSYFSITFAQHPVSADHLKNEMISPALRLCNLLS